MTILRLCTKCNDVKISFSRSKDIVEPLLKPQWYVDCREMAENSVKVAICCSYVKDNFKIGLML